MAERLVLQAKYKALRNKVTRNIRDGNRDFNNNRVVEANNESELWKIANQVTNPKKASEWIIEINGEDVKDELAIA